MVRTYEANTKRTIITEFIIITIAITLLITASCGGAWDVMTYMGYQTNFGLRSFTLAGVTVDYDGGTVDGTGIAVSVFVGLALSLLGIQLLCVFNCLLKGTYHPAWWPLLEMCARFANFSSMFAWMTWLLWAHRQLLDDQVGSPNVGWSWGCCFTGGFFCFVNDFMFRVFGVPPPTAASDAVTVTVNAPETNQKAKKQNTKKHKKQKEIPESQEALLHEESTREDHRIDCEGNESPEGRSIGTQG